MNDQEIERLRNKYNLSYHIPYALEAEKEVGISGKKVLEIGGSLPRDFVIGDLKADQWIALEEMGYYNDISNPFDMSDIVELNSVTSVSDLGVYAVVSGRAEKLTSAFYDQFDVIFSIAAFEHIDRMPIALSRMHRALKPGGKLFTMFSPIWPSRNGHHLHGVTDKKGNKFSFSNSPIPPWGHLLMRPPQMYHHLLSYTDEETAAEIVFNVYNSPAINRLFTEDYVKYFEMSPFEVDTLVGTFSDPAPEDVQRRLETLYPGRKHFSNAGLLVVLTKSPAA